MSMCADFSEFQKVLRFALSYIFFRITLYSVTSILIASMFGKTFTTGIFPEAP